MIWWILHNIYTHNMLLKFIIKLYIYILDTDKLYCMKILGI